MIESGFNYIKIFEDNDFFEIKISCKVFDVFLVVVVYQGFVEVCDYLFYLGVIEVGGLMFGIIKLLIGLGLFFWVGIGDIICVFLLVDLVEEIKVGFDIFKLFNL